MAYPERKTTDESARVVPMGPTLSLLATLVEQPAISLAGRAYLQIRNKILKGELLVGLALSRHRLAVGLNISVPPVTEALQQLKAEGLLLP